MPGRRSKQPKRREHPVSIGIKVPLTAAEVRKLRVLAAADLRSVASLVAWLVAQDLERPATRRPVRGASPRDSRSRHSIMLRLSAPHAAALRKRAKAELRSTSG